MDAASVAIDLIEAFNKDDFDTVAALCAPDITYIEKGTNKTAQGVDAVLEVARGWKASFSDLRGNIWSSASCGNSSVLEIRWTGTNDGPLETPGGTVPATGKSVEFDDAQIYEVTDGKVTEFRNYGDFITMLTQLGLIPG
jgi:steroid delta-isomerase-like uncharacterized protein